MAEHFVGEVAQKAIIEHDGKILFTRSATDSKWDLPGGRLNAGEVPQAGLEREVLEELSLHIQAGSMVFITPINASHFKFPRLFIFYTATLKNPEEHMSLQKEEIAETKWFSKNQIDSVDTHAEWKLAIEAYLKLK